MSHKHMLRVSADAPFEDDESYSETRYTSAQRWRTALLRARWLAVAAVVAVLAFFAIRQVRLTAIDDALSARADASVAAQLGAADLDAPFYLLVVDAPLEGAADAPEAAGEPEADGSEQLGAGAAGSGEEAGSGIALDDGAWSDPAETVPVPEPDGPVPSAIYLVRVDPQAKRLVIVSIAGATAFEMDDYGTRRIEDAYAFGSTAYLVSVVSRFAGVPIAHYAVGDATAFAGIVHEILRSSGAGELDLLARIPEVVASDLSGHDYEKLARSLRGLDFTVDELHVSNPTDPAHVAGEDWEVSRAQEWRTMMQRIDAGLNPEDPLRASDDADGAESGSAAPFDFTGTVLVLNGSGVSGLAATAASTLERVGYEVGIGNTENSYMTSYVLYDSPENEKKAESVNATLGGALQVQRNDTGHELEADVVVILGADRSGAV